MADSPKRRRTASPRSNAEGQPLQSSAPTDAAPTSGPEDDDQAQWVEEVGQLTFQEARTALEIALARMQADALEVEEMAGLYRRAEIYLRRCEAVLDQVEQEVIQWDDDRAPDPA